MRLDLVPRAAQWYPNATTQSFADIIPVELAKITKDMGMRPSEQGYRFILNELMDREVSHYFLLSHQLALGIKSKLVTIMLHTVDY